MVGCTYRAIVRINTGGRAIRARLLPTHVQNYLEECAHSMCVC